MPPPTAKNVVHDLTDAEFAELDELLERTPAPLEPLDAVMLDGYLCGISVQPVLLDPAAWLASPVTLAPGLARLVAELIGTAVEVPGQLLNVLQIAHLGACSQAAQHHRIEHALPQGCHGRLLGPGNIPRDQGTTRCRASLSQPALRLTTASAV